MKKNIYLISMGVCSLLFFFRVFGQIMVGIYQPDFLPDWAEWYSGLLPYPLLLLAQFVILMVMPLILYQNYCQEGIFVLSPKGRKYIFIFAAMYFLVMVFRYAVTMAVLPEKRWLGGAIPVFFHWILAGFLFLWSGLRSDRS